MSIFRYIATLVSGIMTGVVASALYEKYWRQKLLDPEDSDSEYDLPTRHIYIGGLIRLEDVYHEITDINENCINTNQIDIIIQSNNLLSIPWAIEVANTIKNSKCNTRVFVDGYAHGVATVIALSANELYLKEDSTLSTFRRVKSEVYTNGYKGVINDKYDADTIMNEMHHKDGFVEYNKLELRELGIEIYDW